MQYTSITKNMRGFSLTMVHFTGEGKESRYARYMNRFYDALAQAAQDYATACGNEDCHSRYTCHMQATADGGRTIVTVSLSHKRPGMVSGRKQIQYRWCRGVLENTQVI